MHKTLRFSQARANPGHALHLRDRLTMGARMGGELLALASLVVALATTLLALATFVGP